MTLIESCLSVAIITTVTLIAVPALTKTRDDYQLNSVANDVATKMQSARIHAISGNYDCRLRLTSNTAYAVECNNPTWVLVEPVVLPRGFTVTSSGPPEFHRLGSVVPTATVTVSNSEGHQKKVIVNNVGRVRIQ
jgi:type II secretory pathway pseudopilin PulG